VREVAATARRLKDFSVGISLIFPPSLKNKGKEIQVAEMQYSMNP
jgi:hypothetical protein